MPLTSGPAEWPSPVQSIEIRGRDLESAGVSVKATVGLRSGKSTRERALSRSRAGQFRGGQGDWAVELGSDVAGAGVCVAVSVRPAAANTAFTVSLAIASMFR
jgi:hypothetical protein